MAAPVESFLRLADDSAFTGKKLRAQSRTVGANTVLERAVIFDRKASVLGVYEAGVAQQTIQAGIQDGLTTGFLWLHMPSAVTGCSARIRRIYTSWEHSTVLLLPTAPRVRVDRATFTGTATGATVTSDPDTTYRRAKFDVRTASTGLTVTTVAAVATMAIGGNLSAVSAVAPAQIGLHEVYGTSMTTPNEDEFIVIAPGEAITIYQDTAGTASDTRKLNITVVWDEIDTA